MKGRDDVWWVMRIMMMMIPEGVVVVVVVVVVGGVVSVMAGFKWKRWAMNNVLAFSSPYMNQYK